MNKLVLLFLLLATGAHAEEPASYYVPPAQFSASMQVMYMGFSNALAIFRSSTSSFTFNEADKSISNLRIAIDATSLTASGNEIQRDLSTLLGVFENPEIRILAPDSVKFEDNKAEIKGTMTLRGVNKPVTLEATLNKSGKSPYGGGMWSSEGAAVGLSLRTAVKRAEFGVTDNPEAPSRFGDTISFTLEMQGIRQ